MNEDIFNFNSTIEPELEARIIALVLGEASDFETEELNRLIALRPELAAFKQQMEEVHGLMTEVGAGEFEAPGDDWKLPADRRNVVLATIRGEASVQPSALQLVQTVVPSVPTRTPWRRRWQQSLTQVLATACFAGAIASYTFYFQSKERTDSQAVNLARSDADVFWDKTMQSTYGRGQQPTSDSRPSVLSSTSRGTNFIRPDEQPVSQLARSHGESQKNSQQALSVLSSTLNEGATKLFIADNQNGAPNAGGAPGASQDSGRQSYFESDSVSSLIVGNVGDGMAVTGPDPVPAAPGVESFIARNDTDWMARGFGLGNSNEPAVLGTLNSGDDFGTQVDVNVIGVVDFVEKSDPAAAVPQDALLADGKPTVPLYVVPPTEGRSSDRLDSPASAENEPSSGGEEFTVPEQVREAGEAVRGDTTNGPPVNESLDRLQELQQSPGKQSSTWEEKLEARDLGEKAGREQSEYETNIQLDVSGKADNNTDAKWSDSPDESRRSRNVIVDNESQLGEGGFGGRGLESRGGNASGDQAHPFGELHLDRPAEAKPEDTVTEQSGSDNSLKSLAGVDRHLQEENESLQSESKERLFDSPGAGLGTLSAGSEKVPPVAGHDGSQPSDHEFWKRGQTKSPSDNLVDQVAPYRSGSTDLDDPAINLRGEVNSQAMQDLGVLILKGNEADVAKVEETIRGIEAEQVQSLGQTESVKPGAATLGDSAGKGESNGKVVDGSLDGSPSGYAIDTSGARSDIDSASPQKSSGLEAKDSKKNDAATESARGFGFRQNAAGNKDGFYLGHRFQTVDDWDSLQPLAESKSKAAAEPDADSDGETSQGVPAAAKQVPGKARADALQSEAGKQEPLDGVRGRWSLQLQNNDKMSEESRYGSDLKQFSEQMNQARGKKLAERTVEPSVSMNETTAAAEAFSTFSLHVSDVSFKLAAAALARGEWPEAAKVRIEEFVNAFDYGDPLPCNGEKVACVVEQSIHPFLQQRNMLRVSMRTGAEGRASSTPLRLTFLLDNSGSMERADRQDTVRRAFALLSQQLTPIDQVTLISFARQPRLLAEKVGGAEAGQLVKLIDELPSEGGTNIEAALQLAFEKATQQQTSGAQNRIILLTDGAVNLGDADPESLSRLVTMMRDSGVAFDAAGISAEGLNDEVLEALTRKGDGRYYLLDSFEDAQESFVQQIAGALRPSASNVKVQIEFNPKRVGHYKLLGFEKHVLKQEDFRNDAVDAAEMAAAEAGVAMYQFEAKPDGEGDVGSVSVRFRDLSTGQMVENRWPIPYEPDAPRPDQAAPSLRIATSAALLAAKLRGEPLGEAVDLGALSELVSGLPIQEQNNTRVQQLKQMIEQARQVSGK